MRRLILFLALVPFVALAQPVLSISCSADPCISGSTISYTASGQTSVQLVSPTGPVTITAPTVVSPAVPTMYYVFANNASTGIAARLMRVYVGTNTLSVTPTTALLGYSSTDGTPVRTAVSGNLNNYKDVFELSLAIAGSYTNPQEDVVGEAIFTNGGTSSRVGLIYDGGGVWRARFVPHTVTGPWSYSWRVGNSTAYTTGTGSFTSQAGTWPGWIKVDSANTQNFVTANDGKAWWGNGNQGFGGINTVNGLYRAALPAGRNLRAPFTTIESEITEWLGSGLNFWRQNNTTMVAANTSTGKITWDVTKRQYYEKFFSTTHSLGMHVAINLMATPNILANGGWDVFASPVSTMTLLKIYQFQIDWAGYFCDFHELINESMATSLWYNTMGDFIHAHDPYGHLVASYVDGTAGLNFSQIDVVQPHIYFSILNSGVLPSLNAAYAEGLYVDQAQTLYPGKPIYVGEWGNGSTDPDTDWPEHSAYRARIWVEFMRNASSMPWSNFKGDGGTAGGSGTVFVGEIERTHAKILANYLSNFDNRAVKITPTLTVTGGTTALVWAKATPNGSCGTKCDVGAYLNHDHDHSTNVAGTLQIPVAKAGMRGYWIDPSTGVTLATFSPTNGSYPFTYTATIPTFKLDAVMRLTDTAAPSLTVTPTGLTQASQTKSFSQQLTATGGTGSYTWSIGSGSLPDGITLSTAGLVSGTPSSPVWRGYIFSAHVTDGTLSADQSYEVVVQPITNSFAITEKTGSAQTNYPVQIGRAFADHAFWSDQTTSPYWTMRAGLCVDSSCLTVLDAGWRVTQMNVKEYWPSGFIKYAIFTFAEPSLAANATNYYTFKEDQSGCNCSDNGAVTPISKANMLADYDFEADIHAVSNGVTQTASARTMLNAWDGSTSASTGPVNVWTSGNISSTVVFADHSGAGDIGFMNQRYTGLGVRIDVPTSQSVIITSTVANLGWTLPAMITVDYEHICAVSASGSTITTGTNAACTATGASGGANGRGWTAQYGLTSVTRAANIVTVTTNGTHAVVTGSSATVAGVTGCSTDPSGTFLIGYDGGGNIIANALPETTFKYFQTGPNETCSGGTKTVSQPSFGGAANHYLPDLVTFDSLPTTIVAAPDAVTKSVRPIFEITFFHGDASHLVNKARVKVLGENANVAAWTDQVYDLSVSKGNVSRVLAYTRTAAPHAAGTRWTVDRNNQSGGTWTVSTPSGPINLRKELWTNGDVTPVAIDPSLSYLASTQMLPNYDTSKTVSEFYLNQDWTNFIAGNGQEILASSNACWGASGAGWGNPGASAWIGPVPLWDVRYLYTGDIRAQEIAHICSEQGASFSYSFRESVAGKKITPTTGARCSYQCNVSGVGRVASVTTRPTWTLVPLNYSYTVDADGLKSGGKATTGTGSNNIVGFNTNDDSHLPDHASLHYLLTGSYANLEDSWFLGGYSVATANGAAPTIYSGRGPTGAEGATGYNATEIRAVGWGLRDYTRAAAISPDNTPEKSYFETLINDFVAAEEGARCGTLGVGSGTAPAWCATSPLLNNWFGGMPHPMAAWGATVRATVNGTKPYPPLHQWVRNPNDWSLPGGFVTFPQNEYGINFTIPIGTITQGVDAGHIVVNNSTDLAALTVGMVVGVFCESSPLTCRYKPTISAISGNILTLSGTVISGGMPWIYSTTVKSADSYFSYDYLMYALGQAAELGYPTGNLRDWAAKFFAGVIADAGSNPRLSFTGRYPVERLSDGNYFDTFANLKTGWAPAWQTLSSGYTAAGYGSTAPPVGFAALSQTSASYTMNDPNGVAAWSWIAANVVPDSAYNNTPQWAILSRGQPPSAAVAPLITTNSLPGGSVGVNYSQVVSATGSPTITWSIISGSLPPGITGCTGVTGASCTISGTPTGTTQTYTFTVKADNGTSPASTQVLSILVTAVFSITTSTLPIGTVSAAYPTTTIAATGGSGTYTSWAVAPPLSGCNLSLNTSTGVITGTPNTAGNCGTVSNGASVTVTVTDSSTATASKSFLLSINSNTSAPIITLGTPNCDNVTAWGMRCIWTTVTNAIQDQICVSSDGGATFPRCMGVQTQGSGTTLHTVRASGLAPSTTYIAMVCSGLGATCVYTSPFTTLAAPADPYTPADPTPVTVPAMSSYSYGGNVLAVTACSGTGAGSLPAALTTAFAITSSSDIHILTSPRCNVGDLGAIPAIAVPNSGTRGCSDGSTGHPVDGSNCGTIVQETDTSADPLAYPPEGVRASDSLWTGALTEITATGANTTAFSLGETLQKYRINNTLFTHDALASYGIIRENFNITRDPVALPYVGHLIFDRIRVKQSPSVGQTVVLQINGGTDIAVVNSDVSVTNAPGAFVQNVGVDFVQTQRTLRSNNRLYMSGMGLFTEGGYGIQSTDGTDTRNYSEYPATDRGRVSSTCRQEYELKTTQRLKMEGNVLANQFECGQTGAQGATISLNSRASDDGSSPLVSTNQLADISIQYNTVIGGAGVFDWMCSGVNNQKVALASQRWRVKHNISYHADGFISADFGGPYMGQFVNFANGGCEGIDYQHNTHIDPRGLNPSLIRMSDIPVNAFRNQYNVYGYNQSDTYTGNYIDQWPIPQEGFYGANTSVKTVYQSEQGYGSPIVSGTNQQMFAGYANMAHSPSVFQYNAIIAGTIRPGPLSNPPVTSFAADEAVNYADPATRLTTTLAAANLAGFTGLVFPELGAQVGPSPSPNTAAQVYANLLGNTNFIPTAPLIGLGNSPDGTPYGADFSAVAIAQGWVTNVSATGLILSYTVADPNMQCYIDQTIGTPPRKADTPGSNSRTATLVAGTWVLSCAGGNTGQAGGFAPAVFNGTATSTGGGVLAPPSMSFPTTSIGATSAPIGASISNTDSTNAGTITALSIDNSAEFIITNNFCTSGVAASTHCNFDVQFTPTVGGSHTGTLTATWTGIAGSPSTISLSGTASGATTHVVVRNGKTVRGRIKP